MSFVFRETLRIGAALYEIDTRPLEPYLAALPTRPPRRVTPFNDQGYLANWTIHEDVLYLLDLSGSAFVGLFEPNLDPVAAIWFSGVIHGWRGARRRTGWPPRTFHDEEIVLELVQGKVVRMWQLDLRAVPDQSDDELRLSLPEFLWPARLRSRE